MGVQLLYAEKTGFFSVVYVRDHPDRRRNIFDFFYMPCKCRPPRMKYENNRHSYNRFVMPLLFQTIIIAKEGQIVYTIFELYTFTAKLPSSQNAANK